MSVFVVSLCRTPQCFSKVDNLSRNGGFARPILDLILAVSIQLIFSNMWPEVGPSLVPDLPWPFRVQCVYTYSNVLYLPNELSRDTFPDRNA